LYSFIVIEKAVVFQTIYCLFLYKYSYFFEKSNCFVGEKPLLFSIKADLLRIMQTYYKPVLAQPLSHQNFTK